MPYFSGWEALLPYIDLDFSLHLSEIGFIPLVIWKVKLPRQAFEKIEPAPQCARCVSRGSCSRPRTPRCFLALPNITNKTKGTLQAHETSGCIMG